MGPGVLVALQVLDQLLARASTIGALIAKAQTEKRDVSEAELDALASADDAARAALQDAINKARGQ